MSSAVGKCGCLCGVCPLNKENLLTMDDRIRTSEGCSKYLNWTPRPEKLKQCWGCQSEEGFKYLPKCNMRMCAFYNEVENCAYCSAFPCEDIQRHSRERVEERIGIPVPEEDYKSFVQPWEGAKNLEKIRKTLSDDKIVTMKTYSLDLKIVDFPEKLNFQKEELDTYRRIHKIIKTIEPLKNLTYARAQVRKKEREYLVKLLWILGSKGKIVGADNEEQIKLESTVYFKEMKGTRFYSTWETMEKRFDIFRKKGIILELEPDISMDNILTPSKSLRKEGWSLKMSFDVKSGDSNCVKAFYNYSRKLFEKHGKNGFGYFTKADMGILI